MTIAAIRDLPAERRLEAPLLRFLASVGRIRHDTAIVHEFPWNGRRIDIVTRTVTGVISAYELKIGNVSRAIEQATYNTLSFDRSWIVVDREVRASSGELCVTLGIGIIIVDENGRANAADARSLHTNPETKRRLTLKLAHRRFR